MAQVLVVLCMKQTVSHCVAQLVGSGLTYCGFLQVPIATFFAESETVPAKTIVDAVDTILVSTAVPVLGKLYWYRYC